MTHRRREAPQLFPEGRRMPRRDGLRLDPRGRECTRHTGAEDRAHGPTVRIERLPSEELRYSSVVKREGVGEDAPPESCRKRQTHRLIHPRVADRPSEGAPRGVVLRTLKRCGRGTAAAIAWPSVPIIVRLRPRKAHVARGGGALTRTQPRTRREKDGEPARDAESHQRPLECESSG